MDGNLKILKIQRGRMYDEPKMKKIVNQQQQNRYWATIEIHPSTMYFGNISITILQSSSSKFLLWSPSKSHHHQKFFPPIEYINVFLGHRVFVFATAYGDRSYEINQVSFQHCFRSPTFDHINHTQPYTPHLYTLTPTELHNTQNHTGHTRSVGFLCFYTHRIIYTFLLE